MPENSEPLVYFDANPFMYAFESGPETAAPVLALLDAIAAKPGAGATSELVLGELLAPVRRPNAVPVQRRRRIYLNLLVFNTFFDLRPVTRGVILETAKLREHTKLKLVDAIHVATALDAGCRYFLSNDGDSRQMPANLVWVKPDRAGIETMLGVLA